LIFEKDNVFCFFFGIVLAKSESRCLFETKTMNYLCKVNGKIVEIDEITDKHLKQKFEFGAKELLNRVPSLNSIKQSTEIIAYIENGLLRFRVNLINHTN